MPISHMSRRTFLAAYAIAFFSQFVENFAETEIRAFCMPVVDAFHKLIIQQPVRFIWLCWFVRDAGTVDSQEFTLPADRKPVIPLNQSPAV